MCQEGPDSVYDLLLAGRDTER
jgi:hypothetical protein